MKKKTLYEAMAIGLLFTSCTADNLSEPVNNSIPLERDQTFYVNMAIHGDIPNGTRSSQGNGSPEASDFSDGDENGINNAYFVFYDEDGNVVGDIVPIENLGTPETSIVEESVEKWYSSTIPVVVRKGEKSPTSVICYINPISPSTLQNPLNVIQTISRTATYTTVGSNRYFAMSNSVYYPDQTSSQPQIAVPIPTKKDDDGKVVSSGLFKTADEAKAALSSGSDLVVNVYVERYASKLSFSTVAATPYQTRTRIYDDNGNYTTADVSLAFTAQRWAVNAESNRSYVIKSFRQENPDGQILADNYTWATLNSRINALNTSDYGNSAAIATVLDQANRWAWNSPSYRRSYWAISPAYFQASYPVVADDVEDAGVINQTYLTYRQLTTAGENQKGFAVPAAGASSTQYFRETTVGTKALTSANPAAAMPSVILVGQYNVTVGSGTSAPVAFYTYLNGDVDIKTGETTTTESRPYVYFDCQTNTTSGAVTSIESKVANGGSMLKRFIAQSTILYKFDGTNYTRFTIADAKARLADNGRLGLAVSAISDEVKQIVDDNEETSLKLQANARSLQITSAAEAEGIYIATGDGYMRIVADNYGDAEGETFNSNTMIKLTKANSILMQQVGYAYFYDNGHAYFNIPVKHLGWYRMGNTQKDSDKIDWSLVRVGDFGMVRNHVYEVNVNKIVGLASGISSNDTPIVPPASTDEYYIAYSVRILKWAVVPVQNEEL